MSTTTDKLLLVKTILSNPQLIKVNPSINMFLIKYMQKFNIQNVGGRLVLHSHLPPINSPAFSRFIDEHLLAKTEGPSHAQVGITNVCPQNCAYCYNKNRAGKIIDKNTIKGVIRDLKDMGVIWLGLTGGEPLLNKDIVEIVAAIGDDCAVKMFTGGYNLTPELASDLKEAGLFYVSISLDHWLEKKHDKIRRCKGSFGIALKAIDIFKEIGGIHIGVSTVLPRSMLHTGQVEEFIQFLIKAGVHEAWLSEVKPAIAPLWDENIIITDEERISLIKLQDRYNKQGQITINYLGHFESEDHFGCNAGHKMVYIDAFGEVSPCVFSPITFGNVNDDSLKILFKEMKKHFPSDNNCFVNANYKLFARYYNGQLPIGKADTLKMMNEVQFRSMSEFFRLYYK
ncbi:radical sam domain protein [hydrocarbon metagenome]|uniref:Radical sam domain protein n=1 Tax=hydrocarbon metagenome TaxID=938273 RepID=A0A0W8E375_9ZZZZ